MPRISQKTRHRVAEHVLGLLMDAYPAPLTTREIARDLARDKEFIKTILETLRAQGLVKTRIQGTKTYSRWLKWQLTDEANKKLGGT